MASSSKQQSHSPASRSPSPSRVLTTLDVQQGNILWLAPKEETLQSLRKRSQYASEPVHCLTNPGIVPDVGYYSHPILVISRPANMPDTIHFLHLTTFSGQKLEKRFRKGASVAYRKDYLTMAPGSNHPLFEAGDPMYRTLHLENGEAMERRGYVNVSEVYSMNWRDAQPFWRGDPSLRQKTRLDAASLRLLLFATQQIGNYTPGEQYVHSATGSRQSSSKSPVPIRAAAAKAPQQPPVRRPLSAPESSASRAHHATYPGAPTAPTPLQAARTTVTTRTHPTGRRSPTVSLPGERDRVWDEERQPLLSARQSDVAVRRNGELGNEASLFERAFAGVKNMVLGSFRFIWWIVRFIARVIFT